MQAPHTKPCGQPTGHGTGRCEPLAACAQVHFGAGEARPRPVQWTRHGRCEPLAARDQAQSGKNRPRRGTASVTRGRAPVRASPGRRAPRPPSAPARARCGRPPARTRPVASVGTDARPSTGGRLNGCSASLRKRHVPATPTAGADPATSGAVGLSRSSAWPPPGAGLADTGTHDEDAQALLLLAPDGADCGRPDGGRGGSPRRSRTTAHGERLDPGEGAVAPCLVAATGPSQGTVRPRTGRRLPGGGYCRSCGRLGFETLAAPHNRRFGPLLGLLGRPARLGRCLVRLACRLGCFPGSRIVYFTIFKF
jgi:hypothetical protein